MGIGAVIFDFNGEALVGGDVAGSLGDGPTLEHAAPAEAEVIVKARGCMLLHNEGQRAGTGHRLAGGATRGFGGDVEVAHGAIALELAIDGLRGLRV